jgi:hypothetical protein
LKGKKTKEEILFLIILLLFMLVITWSSFSYKPAARLIPLALGVTGLSIVCLQLLMLFSPVISNKLKFLKTSQLGSQSVGSPTTVTAGMAADKSIQLKTKWLDVLRFFAWLIVYLLLLYVNPLLAALAFLILFCIFESKLSFSLTIKLSLGIGAFLYTLFGIFLRIF